MGQEIRSFACTACGKCCNRGPEIELSEATRLADTFVTSLIFRVHSLPLNERSSWARHWWERHGSRIPLRPALEESRRHLATFASRRRSERAKERETYLTISAIVNDYTAGRCPALADRLCNIYDRRPHSCRTVPLHYSRPPSTLTSYLDAFVETDGYECDAVTAPVVLNGNALILEADRRHRTEAVTLAKADSGWKEHILAAMDDPEEARRVGLPTYEAVLENSDRGFATVLPMIVAWRVAEERGLMSLAELRAVCGMQASVIGTELAKDQLQEELASLLPFYSEAASLSSSEPRTRIYRK